MSYSHKISSPTYISDAFKKMKEDKKWIDATSINYLFHLFILQFTDIKNNINKEIAIKIFNAIQEKKSDTEIFKLIFTWYKNLTNEDKQGWPMTDTAFRKFKINSIKVLLGPSWIQRHKNTYLVDVGAGDCYITKMVSDITEMNGIAVDINTDIDWGYEKRDYCDEVTKIIYSGNDLYPKIHKKYPTQTISLIMYNHSLHHFNSHTAIEQSLSQAHKLLSPDGFLLIREHDNKDMDIDINLQHILISLRQVIDHNPNWNFFEVNKYMNTFKDTFQSHYMTSGQLINFAKKSGFELLKKKKSNDFPNKYRPDNYWEMSNAYYYLFKPKNKNKTRKQKSNH